MRTPTIQSATVFATITIAAEQLSGGALGGEVVLLDHIIPNDGSSIDTWDAWANFYDSPDEAALRLVGYSNAWQANPGDGFEFGSPQSLDGNIALRLTER